jgi:hypothetical protein
MYATTGQEHLDPYKLRHTGIPLDFAALVILTLL